MSSSGIVAEIKSKLPVLEVVGETVTLKRAGTVYKGLCPFHAEKTPSFIVTPDRETWHCFGCGEHGDIFTFLMRRDGLEFREALTRLAERAGVELSERSAREDREKKRLRDALEAAVAWYREVLRQAHQAERARAYLSERGFSDETLERFGIGYAPNTWDSLSKRLRERGFRDAELIGSGLASANNRGGVYDRFRGRIIIPIRDASGRAIGLGGRIMPGAEGPKYVNSPATRIFDKSRTLYAIDLAKTAIRREKLAVIVEGYTDVMAAHQAGFTNVVASLGTALTRGQVELATKYADAVALAYDVDLAGEAATQRGLIEELGPDVVRKVRVIRIPAGKDPDELVRSDPEAWRQSVAEAAPVMDYFMERETGHVDGSSVTVRLDAAEKVLAQLVRIRDPLWQGTYLQELARRLNLNEQDLRQRMSRTITIRPEPVRMALRVPTPEVVVEPSPLTALEARALELLLRFPALEVEVSGDDALPLRDQVAREVANAWLTQVRAADGGGADLAAFVASLDPVSAEVTRSVLADGANGEPRLGSDEARDAFRVCLLRLREERLEERLRNGRLLLEEALREGERERLEQIERKMDQLGREKAEVTEALRSPAPLVGGRRS